MNSIDKAERLAREAEKLEDRVANIERFIFDLEALFDKYENRHINEFACACKLLFNSYKFDTLQDRNYL